MLPFLFYRFVLNLSLFFTDEGKKRRRSRSRDRDRDRDRKRSRSRDRKRSRRSRSRDRKRDRSRDRREREKEEARAAGEFLAQLSHSVVLQSVWRKSYTLTRATLIIIHHANEISAC